MSLIFDLKMRPSNIYINNPIKTDYVLNIWVSFNNLFYFNVLIINVESSEHDIA